MRAPRLRYSTLRRRSGMPVWLSIGWRVALVLALVGLAIAVHWFDRAGLRDNADGHISFIDVVYFTMISITTTGYGDIAPVSNQARLFDALVVTPIRIFVVLIFIGTAYSFVFKRTWDKWRMALIQRNLTGHVVVAGYGSSGAEAVNELIARGTKASDIVVVDPSPAAIARAEEQGCNVFEGDATRDTTLKDVRIDHARTMIVTAGRDDTSILICLTARHLAPDIAISIAVRAEDNELPARQAGANVVINPTSFTGLLLAGSCYGPHITDYMLDLAAADGRVQLAERSVHPNEVGQPLRSVTTGAAVRLYRDGEPFGFWEAEAQSLMTGDQIVEIIPGTGKPRANG
jgi:voltage-gated potassium channel